MPAGYDAEVAELFRDLRVASSLTETDLASRIATPVEVVLALEQGAIYALPPWPETCRVVNAYGTLLNLDTRPLLRRIYAQLEAGVVELGPKPMPDVPVMVPPAGGNAGPAFAQAPQQNAPQNAQQNAPQNVQQAPAWPNGQGGAPHPAQPQAPQPDALQAQNPQPQSHPPQMPQAQAPQQAAWPGAAPQPNAEGRAPGLAPAAPPWPNDPHGAPAAQGQAYAPNAALQPQRAAQPQTAAQPPNAAQPQNPAQHQEDAMFPGEALPLETPQGHAQDGGLQLQDDATFPGEAALEPEPLPKKKKSALLKWGLGALVAGVVLIGLLIAFGGSSGDTGLMSGFSTSDPVLDPDDPRSRKADRLPDNFQ